MYLYVDDPENPGTKIQVIPADFRIMDSKIQVIKAVRSCSGLGLKESKEIVERFFAEIDSHMWTEQGVADRVNRLVSLDKKLELLKEWKARQPAPKRPKRWAGYDKIILDCSLSMFGNHDLETLATELLATSAPVVGLSSMTWSINVPSDVRRYPAGFDEKLLPSLTKYGQVLLITDNEAAWSFNSKVNVVYLKDEYPR